LLLEKKRRGELACLAILQGVFEESRCRRMVVVKNVVKGVIKLEPDAVSRGEGKYATDFRFILRSRLDL
jgi:hypothetical protein